MTFVLETISFDPPSSFQALSRQITNPDDLEYTSNFAPSSILSHENIFIDWVRTNFVTFSFDSNSSILTEYSFLNLEKLNSIASWLVQHSNNVLPSFNYSFSNLKRTISYKFDISSNLIDENFFSRIISYFSLNENFVEYLISTFNFLLMKNSIVSNFGSELQSFSLFYNQTHLDNFTVEDKVYPVFSSIPKPLFDHLKPLIIEQQELKDTVTSNLSFLYSSSRINSNSNITFNITSFENFPSGIKKDLPRYNCIKVPSWTRSASDSDIEIVSYTSKQLFARRTSFVPYFKKINTVYFLDGNLTEREVFFFAFFSTAQVSSNYSYYNFTNNQYARINAFLNKCHLYDGLSLFDTNLYLKKIKESKTKFLDFSSVMIETLPSSIFDDFPDNSFVPNSNFFSYEQNQVLTSKVIVDEKLKLKANKINTLLQQKKRIISEKIYPRLREIEYDLRDIKNYEEQLRQKKERLLQTKKTLQSKIQENVSSYKYILANSALAKNINNQYKDSIAASIRNNNFESTNFLNNISDKVKILSITFNDTLNNKTYVYTSNNTDLFNNDILSNYLNNQLLIKEIEFSTVSPSKIKVDGSSSKIIAGGPYTLKVLPNSLNIKLASLSSIFGYKTGSFLAHPHSSSCSRFQNLLNEYKSCCLGEASPLIYNAFQKNDISLIIMSVLTWIESANSADVWGKRYNFFPNWQDYISSSTALQAFSEETEIDPDEITDNEVSDFLETQAENALFEEPVSLLPPDLNFDNIPSQQEQLEEEPLVQEQNQVQEQLQTEYVPYTRNVQQI